MSYTMRANTPEELRAAIVDWLKKSATYHRIRAGNARLVAARKQEAAMGIAYQDAAEFIEKCDIVMKS